MDNIFSFYLGGQRKDTFNNHEAAMACAVIWSLKSKDPSTQVGACIINNEGRHLSSGYNGTPIPWKDEVFPWGNDVKQIGEENTKYPYVIHAEMNAITNYRGSNVDLRDSTIYVTLFPCVNCAKLIVQSGIKKVVYLTDDRKATDDNKWAKRLFDNCGIEYIDFNTLINTEGLENVEEEKTGKVLVKKIMKKMN